MKAKKKYIEAQWNIYRLLLPPDASVTQKIETRRAFYAGAGCLLSSLVATFGPGTEPTDADVKVLEDVNAELQDFLKHVANGVM